MRYEKEYNKLVEIKDKQEKITVHDYEADHHEADKILCKILENEGLEHIVTAFNSIEKYYS